MRLIFAFILFSFIQTKGITQYDDLIFDNVVYVDYIKSVQLAHRTVALSMPIIDLNSSGSLKLDFDDMEGGYKNYIYKIIHCDKDWYPSQLTEIEYIDGFNNEEIDGFAYSTNGYSEYTHYKVIIPNDDIRWTISGNYLLVITDDDLNVPVLSRRFVVTENAVNISVNVTKPQDTRKIRTHQELQVNVNYNNLRVDNPRQSLYLTVLQNTNWYSGLYNVQGTFEQGTTIYFKEYNLINFPALKEFRNVDVRTIKSRREFVHTIEQNDTETLVLLDLGRKRSNRDWETVNDANGGFVIENDDFPNGEVSGEYVKVIFTLETDRPYLNDIYAIGSFCDWQAKPEYKLNYDSERELYHGSAYFKQGYYDYMFAMEKEDGQLDIAEIEGTWYETENDYQVLVYYRDLNSIYDRVLGVANITAYPE